MTAPIDHQPVQNRVDNLGTAVHDTPSHAHAAGDEAPTPQAFRMTAGQP